MAFTVKDTCGWESGNANQWGSVNISNCSIYSTNPYTGTYALKVGGSASAAYVRTAAALGETEVYFSVYLDPDNCYTDDYIYCEAQLTDGTLVGVRFDNGYWDAYVNGSKVADGTRQAVNDWHNLKVRISINDTTGIIQTKVAGVDDINYSGDTEPGSGNTISYINFRKASSGINSRQFYIDDITVGTGGWPRAARYTVIVPGGDSSVEWTPSTGVTNYNLVDEIPNNDSDYVSSAGSTAMVDKYTLGDWDGSNKTPLFVTAFARADKDDADDHRLILMLDDGSESSSGSLALGTSKDYVHYTWGTPPSGGSWDEATIDALLAGIESVIIV